MEQPPVQPSGHWSSDRLWWWDGRQWVPAHQAPMPPPPAAPPAYYYGSASNPLAPSPGLRPFLIVVLVIDTVLTLLFALFGTAAVIQGPNDTGTITLWLVFVLLFLITVAALVGVVVRARWARWAAIAAGVAISLTCLGLIVGIPIIVAAARAPLARTPAPS